MSATDVLPAEKLTEAPAWDANFRALVPDDVPRIVEMGHRFFAESDMREFAEYAPANLERALHYYVESPTFRSVVFEVNGQIEGFLFYSLDVTYTTRPLALMFLLYVSPEYRRGPAGRLLVQCATDMARDHDNAVAFYAGAMAGIPAVSKTLPALYRRLGFEDLDFWGRKLL